MCLGLSLLSLTQHKRREISFSGIFQQSPNLLLAIYSLVFIFGFGFICLDYYYCQTTTKQNKQKNNKILTDKIPCKKEYLNETLSENNQCAWGSRNLPNISGNDDHFDKDNKEKIIKVEQSTIVDIYDY